MLTSLICEIRESLLVAFQQSHLHLQQHAEERAELLDENLVVELYSIDGLQWASPDRQCLLQRDQSFQHCFRESGLGPPSWTLTTGHH